MIFDVDDVWEGHDRLDLLCELKAANPEFKVTAFAAAGRGTEVYWQSLPDWMELACHGWKHPDAHEAAAWTYEEALDVLLATPVGFVDLWKSPGWQISDGTYRALVDLEWAVADQHYNDDRRPIGIMYHCEGDGDHVHTHVDDVCGNGLSETFPALLERVIEARTFEFVSEVVKPWQGVRVAA